MRASRPVPPPPSIDSYALDPARLTPKALPLSSLSLPSLFSFNRASLAVLLPLFAELGDVQHHVVVPARLPATAGVGTRPHREEVSRSRSRDRDLPCDPRAGLTIRIPLTRLPRAANIPLTRLHVRTRPRTRSVHLLRDRRAGRGRRGGSGRPLLRRRALGGDAGLNVHSALHARHPGGIADQAARSQPSRRPERRGGRIIRAFVCAGPRPCPCPCPRSCPSPCPCARPDPARPIAATVAPVIRDGRVRANVPAGLRLNGPPGTDVLPLPDPTFVRLSFALLQGPPASPVPQGCPAGADTSVGHHLAPAGSVQQHPGTAPSAHRRRQRV